ncbi:MAG: PD-(D/E)XK nuclease family protein [Acidobacteriota bacterium]|nr:PD-(D/E)XK nuclease family protein [Acidobacteriota bacterium]
MSCILLTASSFPQLLKRLLIDIQENCQQDPLSPKWIITPTSTVANHLRLQVAKTAQQEVHAGVRIIPLTSFVRDLNMRITGNIAQRWGPALDLLLSELVERLPPSSALATLKEIPSGYALLRATFLDMADGGFGVAALPILEELSMEPDMTRPEAETIRLFMSWIQAVERDGLDWEPLSHQMIPEWITQSDDKTLHSFLACEQDQTPRFFVYGFYGFTDVNAQIIAALGRRVQLTLLYPFLKAKKQSHPAFDFGQSILEDLKSRFGTLLEETTVEIADSDQSSQVTTHFFLDTFPEGKIPAQPSFLTFQRASGVRAEVISAAVRVRKWIDQENPLPLEEIMLVAPDPKPYIDVAEQIFADFAIPLRIVDVPMGLTPEVQPLQMLARIWEDQAPAEWILAYLRDYPEIVAAQDIDINQWESKVRRLGVWSNSSWRLILELQDQGPTDTEKDLPRFTDQERALVKEIVELWGSGSMGAQPTLSNQQAALFLEQISERWLPHSSPLEALLKALYSAHPEQTIKTSLLRELFSQGVPDQIRTDLSAGPSVIFLPLMRARGLTSRGIVLLGLASGNWPPRMEEDPLFSDPSRARLVVKAREVGHLLPLKSHITEEMSLLFFLSNTSSQNVHWVVPETDETGRSVAPTPWLQRYLGHWSRDSQSEKKWDRIPRGPIQQSEYLFQLHPNTGSLLPPDLLALAQPDRKGLQYRIPDYEYLAKVSAMRKQKELTWNGHIPDACLPTSHDGVQRVRVTDLENLSKCPYRFYADCHVEWKPLQRLVFADQMSGLDWGNLVHDFLEFLITPTLDLQISVQETARTLLSSNAKGLEQAAQEFVLDLPKPLKVLPELFRKEPMVRLVRIVKDYLEQILAGKCKGDFPIAVELKRRVLFPGLDLKISGQIDRIDERDGVYSIYDYKSSRSVSSLKKAMRLGYRIQPVLYPWIFNQEATGPHKSNFSFVFLGDSPPVEKPLPEDDSFQVEFFLEPLREILKEGLYLPLSRETLELHQSEKGGGRPKSLNLPSWVNPCTFCNYASLCRRFDHGAPERYFSLSKKWLSSRIDAILSVTQKKV